MIDKTSFTVSMPIKTASTSGLIRVDGRVQGQIDGFVIGEVHGIIRGDANLSLRTGKIEPISETETKAIEEVEAELNEDK
ncbi:MAG: hypothetical protein U0L12_04815 [Ruminococcus sp.]|nr:hypothetical protein [Ruminococcus sp.]